MRSHVYVGFIAVLLCGLTACGGGSNPDPFLEDRVLNIAHRGGNRVAPEATMEAFESALDLGADILEMDVQRTSDGQIIVMHDSTVDRTTDGTGAVSTLTLAEIKALDAGYDHTRDGGETYPLRGQGIQVPTLAEVLDAFPDEYMIIEIKGTDPSVSADYAAVLREHGAVGRVITASFSEDVLAAFRAALPEARTSLAQAEVVTFFALSTEAEGAYVAPGEFLHVPPRFSGIDVMTPDFVARADRLGLPIHVFGTGNREETMQRMIDLGARGLMVDDIDLARQVIERSAG